MLSNALWPRDKQVEYQNGNNTNRKKNHFPYTKQILKANQLEIKKEK